MIGLPFSPGTILTRLVLVAGLAPGLASPARAAEPQDQLNLLRQAEELMRAKKWPDAAAAWQRVLDVNPDLGRAWQNLGTAHLQAKEYRKAIPAYEKALELRAGYPWAAAYNIACCHALLGEKKQALQWVEKSFALGFRRLHEARDDADLKALHDEPRFRELVALVDTSKMSRAEGWRYDLKLLVRELKRIHYHLSKRPGPPEFDVLARKLHDDIPRLSDNQAEVGLMKLAAMAGDGHTTMSFPFFVRQRHKIVPMEFYLFAEGLFITSAAPQHKDLAGARVLRFGEQPVAKVLAALDPVISRDNKMWLKHISPMLMAHPQILNGLGLIPDGEKMTLTVRDSRGKQRTVTLAADAGKPGDDWVDARSGTPGPVPLYLKNRKAAYWFKHLPDSKTVYFQYNAVRNDPGETLEKFCARLFRFIDKTEVDRLVIDLRWNDGGNNFLNRPLVHGLIRCDKINQPGKLFVIVGRNTFSAAMCAATDIERHTNATFVGEPTGSSPNFVGETIRLNLPYTKMPASISDLYWENAVAMDYRTWIAPQIYAPPTFTAYRANRDPALEAILASNERRKSPTTGRSSAR
jgi:tetratricopeptide (TPR) repeat protein